MKKLCVYSLALITTLAFSGCETTDSAKKDSDDDEYIYVSTTNSRIPRKVKKGSSYDMDAGSSPMGSVSGQEARDYIGTTGVTRSSAAD